MLTDVFPSSVHVHHVGLGSAGDNAVWEYAREYRHTGQQGFRFSRDELAARLSAQGHLAKRGNCPTKHIAIILRNQAAQIEALSKDPEAVFLLLL